jgi:antitoxin MazE
MKTRVQKWGNSLAVRIPKSFADEMGVGNNSAVDMMLEDGRLIMKPDREGEWDLESLLAGVTDENLHSEGETEAQEDGPGENDR